MNALSKFGFLVISALSICIILLKIMTHFHLFTGSWLYTDLSSIAVLFAVFFAFGVVFMFGKFLLNRLIALIVVWGISL